VQFKSMLGHKHKHDRPSQGGLIQVAKTLKQWLLEHTFGEMFWRFCQALHSCQCILSNVPAEAKHSLPLHSNVFSTAKST